MKVNIILVIAMGLASSTVMFSMEGQDKILIPREKMRGEMGGRVEGAWRGMEMVLRPFPESYKFALAWGYFKEEKESKSKGSMNELIKKTDSKEMMRIYEIKKQNEIAAGESAKRERQKEAEERERQRKQEESEQGIQRCSESYQPGLVMHYHEQEKVTEIVFSVNKPVEKTISREDMWKVVDERIEEARAKATQIMVMRKQKEAQERAIDEKLRKYTGQVSQKAPHFSQRDKLEARCDRNELIYGEKAVKKEVIYGSKAAKKIVE